jgi:Kef-type K+ transport system membrane component KefB
MELATTVVSPSELAPRVLLAIAVIIVVARAVGWLLGKIGQPRVIGEIIAGIMLGPSLLGLVWPQVFHYLFPANVVSVLNVMAQLGLVMFMFLIGLELDTGQLRGQGHRAIVISHASIIVPFGLGAWLAFGLYGRMGSGSGRTAFVLFVGAAMAISAFPVLVRLLQETGLQRTRLGTLATACAAVDDVTAWCILAVVVAITKANGFGGAIKTIVLSLVFLCAMLWVVRPLLARFANIPVWVGLTVALVSAFTTDWIGIHVIFGGFLAGVVMPHSRKLQRTIHAQLAPVVTAVLLPIFFVSVGLSTKLGLLDTWYLWGIAAAVIAVAIAGKLVGSMLAARVVGERWRDATTIGVLMNTRGLTELIILTVGLQLKVLTPTMFTIMVIMALVTTAMAMPGLALLGYRVQRVGGRTVDELPEPSAV